MRLRYSLLLAFCAACGGSDSTAVPPAAPPPPPPPPGATTRTISMTDYSYTPATVTITAGTIVKWVNNGATSHTATSDEGVSPAFTTGTLVPPGTTTDPYGEPSSTPGGSYQMTFSTPGTYTYHCTFHGGPGTVPGTMTGTITVTQ